MINLYRVRRKSDGKCPCCGRKLAVDPVNIKFEYCGV